MTFATAYLIIWITAGYGVTSQAIPYHSMAQCQEAAKALGDDNAKAGHAYCIEGSK